jgi:hypothetical protein
MCKFTTAFISNVYRKLSEAEVTLLLRIADRSETATVPVAGLRSVCFTAFHSMRPALAWMLLFALVLMVPRASGSSDSTSNDPTDSAWKLAQSDPAALVREAVQNGLEESYGHGQPLRYLLRKKTRNIDTTKEIVETADGDVARLVAIDGHPLSASQEQMELQRLHTLASNPALQEHRRRSEQKDAARIREILRLLPDALLYQVVEPVKASNGQIELTFTPNPRFSPPTLDSRILTGFQGRVWIDAKDVRMVRLEGRIFRNVDFGWGILGTLYPGGTASIEQAKIADCGWQLGHLRLNLTGRELLFKALRIQLEEFATDYHPVPRGWKYTDAIQWLLHMPGIPAAQVGP